MNMNKVNLLEELKERFKGKYLGVSNEGRYTIRQPLSEGEVYEFVKITDVGFTTQRMNINPMFLFSFEIIETEDGETYTSHEDIEFDMTKVIFIKDDL